MKRLSNLIGTCLSASLFVACGGGDNGLSTSTPVTLAPQIGSQSFGSPPAFGRSASRHVRKNLVTETVLYKFSDGTDGGFPAGLTNINDTLYGTTYDGGASYGTVFSVTTAGTYAQLYGFGGPDGATPEAGLTNVNGTLYGTTSAGGTAGYGTVFSLTPGGVENVLHSFGTSLYLQDGTDPRSGMINVNGTLYGTTAGLASIHSNGVLFKITTAGVEKVLHYFAGGSDGAMPLAGPISVNGTLYGTTVLGGAYGYGVVYKVTNGKETVLHSFAGGSDGANPYSDLINVKGTLYGTTNYGGGSGPGYGTVFSITTAGVEKVLYSFTGSPAGDGRNPYAGLTKVNSTLYGTTFGGGAHFSGTVFSITTAGVEKVLYSFAANPDGAYPYYGLTDVNGTLYGTTSGGGYGAGTVYSLSGF
jgi:uncharacterized repeat protein (TIGR03803 family)